MSANKVLGVFCLTLILLLTATGTGFAQDPQPPDGSTEPSAPPVKYPLGGDQLGVGRPFFAQNASDVSTQSLTLGAAGLSYRYVQTFGETRVGYLADTAHINYPYGLGSDGNSIWVTELWGHRALKYDNAGNFQQQLGIAGVYDVYNTALAEITDIAVDGGGNAWVADAANHVVKFDSSGNLLGELGVVYEWGEDNSHFNMPISLAFDASDNIYISDGASWWSADNGNHRIQVFDSSGDYVTTIGETGAADSDNSHFHGPRHIMIYGNQLFVADAGNQRIQIYDITNPASPAYQATIGASGEEGSDNTHFSNPSGVAVDINYIYVADTGNDRVQVFNRNTHAYVATIGSGWGSANNQFKNPTDVLVDSSGNLYVADFVNTRIQQFSHSGIVWTYARTYGVTNVPYLTDNYHYNQPSGVAVAGDGSIYITEDGGHRLVKLNAAGTPIWTVGAAGVKGDWDNANNRLDNPADVALDAAGHVYVADRWHGRVQIYNANGSFYKKIINLGCPGGVTVAPDGRIYVADSCNQTVNIYNSSLSLIAVLGTAGESGSDNTHFNWPEDVVVGGNGNIFVSDQGNQRVQVFNASRVYVRTMGIVGECGSAFDHFCNPNGLFVDSANRLYVADQDNNRIQVFDSNSAYLTTIAGSWGTNNGQLIAPTGVAVDTAGNVYIADFVENHRIQKFAPGVTGWQQKNINGFGDRNNGAINRMTVFNNYLYAGTQNYTTGGEVWRSADGNNWSQVNLDGFGNASNVDIVLAETFNGYLYAGTENSDTGGQMWRCAICNGSDWVEVVSDGFADINNKKIERVVVLANTLYAVTNNDITGVEVWKSSTGNSGSWTQSNTDGFGDIKNGYSWTEAVLGDYLYLGTAQWGVYEANTYTGVEIWRTNDGITWDQVNTDGFGDRENMSAWLAAFDGYLYAYPSNNSSTPVIWRCATCDGTDWAQVVTDGFGDSNNYGGFMLSLGSLFYAGTYNNMTGAQIWQTANGTTWNQVNIDGFGDSNNSFTGSAAFFNGRPFFSTWNEANGAELWAMNIPESITLNSLGGNDGWILESSETSNAGGTMNSAAATFNLGDASGNKQYRAILHFDTSALPDNAVITSAILKIKKQGQSGSNPFTILGGLKVDMRKPAFGTPALALTDFNVAAAKKNVSTFGATPLSNWYSAILNSAGKLYINSTGTTQFRLYFTKDDNNDNGNDFMKFYSGNTGAANRPQLIIEYYVP